MRHGLDLTTKTKCKNIIRIFLHSDQFNKNKKLLLAVILILWSGSGQPYSVSFETSTWTSTFHSIIYLYCHFKCTRLKNLKDI